VIERCQARFASRFYPVPGFDLDLMTNSGEVMIARDDLHKPAVGVRRLYHEANGAGKRIEVRTASGRILATGDLLG
jgi:hypothetical protein